MTRFPDNPFRPGFGRNPACRGRRPEAEAVLSGLLRMLRGGKPDAQAAFLYGPRGNGKTVLLQWLEAQAAQRSQGRPIVEVRLSVTDMASPAAVAQAILNATAGAGDRAGLSVEGSFGLPGLASVRVTGRSRERSLSLAEALSEGTEPLLVTLDEAHEAAPQMLSGLLNVAQEAGRRRPVAAVFAGTPGLAGTLRAAHASFWNRGRKLRIGLLGEEEAREVLAWPFRDAGLEANDEAVVVLAAAADCYPYFLQLYGEAAWQVVEASGGRAFLPEHVAPALAAAERDRDLYYSDRYMEFRDAGLVPLARDVAEAFAGSAAVPAQRRLTDAQLDAVLVRHGNIAEMEGFLVRTGFVWRDDREVDWTPGIPSLMDYMVERIPAPATPGPSRTPRGCVTRG